MKKRLTRGEKLLFATPPLLLLVVGIAVWLRPPALLEALALPDSGNVEKMEFSPDGKRLMTFLYYPSASVPFGRVYDVESLSVVSVLETPRSAFNTVPPAIDKPTEKSYDWPVWSNDGNRITANFFGLHLKSQQIAIWSANSGKLEGDYKYRPNKFTDMYAPLYFSSDDQTLVRKRGSMPIYEVATGKIVNKTSGLSKSTIADIQWNYKSEFGLANDELGVTVLRYFAVGKFSIVDSKTKRLIWSLPVTDLINHKWFDEVLCIQDIQSASSSQQNDTQRLTLWNARTRQQLPSPPLLDGATKTAFAFNPDGKTLAYFNGHDTQSWAGKGFEGELTLWDYRENRILWRKRVSEELSHFEWSRDGKWLAVLGDQPPKMTCQVYDRNGNLRINENNANYLFRFSPDSKKLANYIVDNDELTNFPSPHISIYRLED